MSASPNFTIEKLESNLQSAPASALLRKWTEWRGTKIAPKRSQIRLEELGEALPQVVMVEFISPEECHFLLVGSNLVLLQGLEFTGENFYDMALPEERELRMHRLRELERQPCGTYSLVPGTLSPGTAIYTELLTLPVLPDDPGTSMRGIAVSTPLNNTAHHTPIKDTRVIRVAEEFRFIDIGAGLPGDDPMLRCQAPLVL